MTDETPRPSTRGFSSDFRKFFLRGLGILLPSVLTVGLLVWTLSIMHRYIAEPINGGVRFVILRVVGDASELFGAEVPSWYDVTPEELADARARRTDLDRSLGESQIARMLTREIRREDFAAFWRKHWYLEGIGFVVAIIGIYLAGVFFGNLIGRRVYQRVERFFVRLPLVKQVYPNVKQITDFLVGDGSVKRAMPGSKVVVVEYPRRGIWTVGLLTGGSMDLIERVAGQRLATVFIPSSPTPFTGYTINVPVEEVYEVAVTMDEAIRFVVSGGVLVPPHRQPARFRQGLEHDPLPKAGAADLAAGSGPPMMGAPRPPGDDPGP
ncbi:MAG: DUF502 domain-containing protein [Planctomycetota bacterium]